VLVAAALGLSRTVIVVCGSVTVLVIVDGGSVSVETADMIADSKDWILASIARISESCVPLLAAVSVMVMVFVIVDAVHDGIAVVIHCETEPYEDVVDATVPPTAAGVLVVIVVAAVASKQLQALVRADPPVVPTQLGTGREVAVKYSGQNEAADDAEFVRCRRRLSKLHTALFWTCAGFPTAVLA
jgi:hypothetical protein